MLFDVLATVIFVQVTTPFEIEVKFDFYCKEVPLH